MVGSSPRIRGSIGQPGAARDRRSDRRCGVRRGHRRTRRLDRRIRGLRGRARGCLHRWRSIANGMRSGRRRWNCGSGNGRSLGLPGRRRRRRRAHRQQRQRVDISLRIVCRARPEVHVWLRRVDHAARPDRPDDRALADERPAGYSDRPEVDERRGVAGRRLDRHGLAARRHRPCERDDSVRRGQHRATARSGEIDTAMLAGGVRVRVVERKRPQDRAVDRPPPGAGSGYRERTRAKDQDRKSPHSSSLLPILRTTRPP
jgi:hypothetical protein